MRVVVALGGNALLKRGEPMTSDVQRTNIKVAAQALAPVAKEHQLVLSQGNDPQVGLLALQAAAYEEVNTYPLDMLGFLPVIAPLARFLGLILAYFGVWMSTTTAHELKGWHAG
jgi:carbamate kinase